MLLQKLTSVVEAPIGLGRGPSSGLALIPDTHEASLAVHDEVRMGKVEALDVDDADEDPFLLAMCRSVSATPVQIRQGHDALLALLRRCRSRLL